MSESFDVILKLILDDAALARIKSGASSVADEFKNIEGAEKLVTKEMENQEKVAINAMKKEARAINSLANLRSKELKELKEKAAFIEMGAKPLFAVGVAGITSITLLAKKYIDSTSESNEITKKWAESTAKVESAQMRIGKVAADAILPMYEKLADIAAKGADFIEKNPGVLEAGLKASIVAAGLGGIGLLVAKGIRLYADIQMIAIGDMQLTAAALMSKAADKQLLAATGGKVSNPFGAAAGTAAGGTGAAVAGGGAAAAGGLSITTALGVAAASGAMALALSAGLAKLVESLTGIKLPILTFIEYIGNLTGITKQASDTTQIATGTMIQATAAMQANSAAQAGVTNATANQTRANGLLANSANSANQALTQTPSALQSIGSAISNFISSLFSFGGKATATPPKHDYTGYAYSRTYAMAQDGKRQFVMSGDMTRIAEQMLGGQLNQQSVMSAMAGGAGGKVIWNDRRRFSGEYTKSMRKANQGDTLDLLSQVVAK